MHSDSSIENQPSSRQDQHTRRWPTTRVDTYDPAGIVADLPGRTVRQREREFIIALLEDAFHCYRKYAFSGTRRGRRLFEEVETWLMEPDAEAPITFQHVCDVLGIEPDPIRRNLSRWRSEAATGQIEDVEHRAGDLARITRHGSTSSPVAPAEPLVCWRLTQLE